MLSHCAVERVCMRVSGCFAYYPWVRDLRYFDYTSFRCLLLPVAFVMVSSAQRVMLEVDITELERLRYEYKGA